MISKHYIIGMNEIVKTAQETALTGSQNIETLVEEFISAQDVKQSSKDLYRRTLKQYFTWIEKEGYQLSQIARPQVSVA